MKTRNGFVSNSSSTSFIVMLPEGFDVEEEVGQMDVSSFIPQNEWTGTREELDMSVRERIKRALREKFFAQQWGHQIYCLMRDRLKPYTIGTLNVEEGEGQILLIGDEERKLTRGILAGEVK